MEANLTTCEQKGQTACNNQSSSNNPQILVIPEGEKIIDCGTFLDYDLENITEIILPNSATEIAKKAFSLCTNLQKITIPSSVVFINREAFVGCEELREVIIEDGVQNLARPTFNDCKKLKFNIYRGCKYLGNKENPYYAFIRCKKNAAHISIHPKTKLIAAEAFVRKYGEVCESLTTLEVPDSVLFINRLAFVDCINLKNIVLSKHLKKIGMLAFLSCRSLTEIVIPMEVEEIGIDPFLDCPNLKKITILNPNTQFDNLVDLRPEFPEIVIGTHV